MKSKNRQPEPIHSISRDPCKFADVFPPIQITNHEFARLQSLITGYFGIKLCEQKRTLVVNRLQPLLTDKGFDRFGPYIDLVESDRSGRELIGLVDYISTNHTYFFREKEHFEFLTNRILPDIEVRAKAMKRRDVRLWSAGCSGGDEAYSLIFCLMDYFGDRYRTWDAGLLATDISEKCLAEARAGLYTEKRLLKLPRMFVQRYFIPQGDGMYEVSPEVKREVTFRRLNLKNRYFPFKQPFDVILCRNVMIYFEDTMKERLINTLFRLTRPGGYLLIGHSEALNRKKTRYSYVKPGVYQREG